MLKSRANASRSHLVHQQQQQVRQPQQRKQHHEQQSTAINHLEPSQTQLLDVSPSSKMPTTEIRQKSLPRPHIGAGNSSGSSAGTYHRANTANRIGANKQPKYQKFRLHSINDQSLNSVIQFVSQSSLNRFRTCVVTIISKDSINDSTRDHLVQHILASGSSALNKPGKRQSGEDERSQTNVCQQLEDVDNEEIEYENQVFGHADFDSGLTVLTLDSFMNTSKLTKLSDSIVGNHRKGSNGHQEASVNPLLEAWPKWNQDLIKTLLILFTMSHIVVFYNPEPSIDYHLIQTLKVLEVLRMKSLNRISDLLETIASGQIFSQQWIRNCRLGCPRALFICDTSYLEFDIEGVQKMAQIRDELEEQIYLLLKRSNLIPGAGQANHRSLFCLPDQDDFLFILNQKDLRLMGMSGRQQDGECLDNEIDINNSHLRRPQNIISSANCENQEMLNALRDLKVEEVPNHEHKMKLNQSSEIQNNRQCRFRKFISRHIADIRSSVNQDHDNKQPFKQHSATILPRFDDYFNVLLRLKCLLFPSLVHDDRSTPDQEIVSSSNWPTRDERRFVDIYDLLDVDNLFSQRHCHKARSAAFELYVRSLNVSPCDETTHRNSLDAAVKYYTNQARGSACSTNLKFLEDECNRHWSDVDLLSSDVKDRSSKSGGPATKISSDSMATRRVAHYSLDMDKDNSLCITRRPNGVMVTAGCECGRTSSLLIKPNDRKKKLERVDVYRIND
jgi:hypothetical protein